MKCYHTSFILRTSIVMAFVRVVTFVVAENASLGEARWALTD
jgi:hypothetical protein